jgi:GNAT superfamily N-acetyltransferase
VNPNLTIHPVTPERWDDLERLFGPGGASGGCWCMWFRRRSSEFATAKARENKADLHGLVERGEEPGLIAYWDGEPAGWISLDRRERYPRIENSRLFRPLDDTPVWSVVCFVIGKPYRRSGLSGRLLAAAIEYARERGGTMLEAYPVEPTTNLTGDHGFQGIRSVFTRAGFHEAARAPNGRPIMRLALV